MIKPRDVSELPLLHAEALACVHRGDRVGAAKAYKKQTGLDLAHCIFAVDAAIARYEAIACDAEARRHA